MRIVLNLPKGTLPEDIPHPEGEVYWKTEVDQVSGLEYRIFDADTYASDLIDFFSGRVVFDVDTRRLEPEVEVTF